MGAYEVHQGYVRAYKSRWVGARLERRSRRLRAPRLPFEDLGLGVTDFYGLGSGV